MWTVFKDVQGPRPAVTPKDSEEREATQLHRRSIRTVLTPTMVGSMVVMMPRYENGVGPNWPDNTRQG